MGVTTATIDGRVLDILADERVVECVTKILEAERKIRSAYRAERSVPGNIGQGAINAAKQAAGHTRFFARNDESDLAQHLDARIRLLAEQIAREEESSE